MVYTPIIPNRHIIHRLPLQPNLQIMVLHNQLHKPLQEMLALLIRQAMNPLHMVAHCKDRAPPCDGVGTHHGVDGVQRVARVFGRAARAGVKVETVAAGGFAEEGLGVGGGQGVEETAEGWGDAIVKLVARSPERVCEWGVSGGAVGLWGASWVRRVGG